MPRRSKQNGNEITLSVWKSEFFVQEDGKEGIARFQYERRKGHDYRDLHVDLPLISLWVDQGTGDALRAHMYLGRNKRQVTFYNDVIRSRQLNMTTSQRCIVASTASAQRVLVYEPLTTDAFRTYDYDAGTYRMTYNTKAQALTAIVRNIEIHRAIGGLNFASLQTVSDDVLLQMGFTKIEDVFGRGLPMWSGSPEILRQFSYHSGAREEQQEMADQFLLLLNEELRKDTKQAA